MKIFLADDAGNLHLVVDKISKYYQQRFHLNDLLVLDEGDPMDAVEILKDIHTTIKQIEEKEGRK